MGLTRLSGVINKRHGLGNTALKHPDQVTAWMAVFDVTASFHYTRVCKRKQHPLVPKNKNKKTHLLITGDYFLIMFITEEPSLFYSLKLLL